MAKRSKSPKRPVPLNEIEQHFAEQLRFLEKSIYDFDAGDTSEFKRMAATIRTLLYDGPTSYSVATQLGIKTFKFVADGGPYNPRNLLPEWPLALVRGDMSGMRFIPVLDQGPEPRRKLDFDAWWTEIVLKDETGVTMSRGDLVLIVANQAGGAHVDPEIDERYHRLAKEHSIGVMIGSGPHPSPPLMPLEHIEKVYLRHIAHEVLATLKPLWQSILGNQGCGCGSGRKARYCCLKGKGD